MALDNMARKIKQAEHALALTARQTEVLSRAGQGRVGQGSVGKVRAQGGVRQCCRVGQVMPGTPSPSRPARPRCQRTHIRQSRLDAGIYNTVKAHVRQSRPDSGIYKAEKGICKAVKARFWHKGTCKTVKARLWHI